MSGAMKGAMKPRHLALGAALLLAAGLVLFGDTTPEATLAEPVERAARPARTATPSATPGAPAPGAAGAIARLIPRATLIGAPGDRFGEAEGEGSLFARQDWTPPPPPPAPLQPAPPAPPPQAPPLPFTFIGKSLQDGVWEIYLARNGQTYLVRLGATLEGTYRVDAIAPPVLTLTYLPLDQVQQMNIGGFD